MKICLGCNEPFIPKTKSRRFCSRSCAIRTLAKSRVGQRNSNWRGGTTKHPLYETYLEMIGRCHRPTHKRYGDYGGRGIRVCQRWLDSFWNFVDDMGSRPRGLTLERVNNDRGYEPENCRWASYSDQARNRRHSAYAGSRQDPQTGRFLPKVATA